MYFVGLSFALSLYPNSVQYDIICKILCSETQRDNPKITMKNNLIERVLKTIRNYDMFKAGDTVLVAVSGGPDSIFLLKALDFLQKKLKLKKIIVCNLDHGIRGKESSEDSYFVRKLAEEHGLGFVHKRISVPDQKPKELSIEEAAREERYKFFSAAAKAVKADVIATGHTMDDRPKPYLCVLLRGLRLKAS